MARPLGASSDRTTTLNCLPLTHFAFFFLSLLSFPLSASLVFLLRRRKRRDAGGSKSDWRKTNKTRQVRFVSVLRASSFNSKRHIIIAKYMIIIGQFGATARVNLKKNVARLWPSREAAGGPTHKPNYKSGNGQGWAPPPPPSLFLSPQKSWQCWISMKKKRDVDYVHREREPAVEVMCQSGMNAAVCANRNSSSSGSSCFSLLLVSWARMWHCSIPRQEHVEYAQGGGKRWP